MAAIVEQSREKDAESEPPQLSDYAQAALREFYAEREARQQELESRLAAGDSLGAVEVEEDWQLSQFWYDDSTALRLAEEALDGGRNKRIACISCPTLYAKLLQIKPTDCETVLLEYDRRFEIYGDNFVHYDYTKPLQLPDKFSENYFDIVVADPPYLSEECLEKVAKTVAFLTRGKVLLCTGAVMEHLASKLLSLKICLFLPQHTRNLANEFRCFVNYKSKLLNSH